MDTVVQSRSRTVVIGPEQPFCVIGERINPTGRKTFQAQLQAGDLSRIETDVAQQVEGGADMLDVNVGDPLADEVGLMTQAIPMVQALTDIPLCIDSSVIEALEAGLEAYEGKALVNSVTGEDERLEAILPIVAKYGAAVIGLANAEDIPMEAERRVAVAKKIVSVAGDYGIPPEDVDHRSARDADRRRASRGHALHRDAAPAARRARRQHHVRRRQHVIRTARPAHPRCCVPRRRAESRADERDHGFAATGDGRSGARDRFPARTRRVGRDVDRESRPQPSAGSTSTRGADAGLPARAGSVVIALEDLPEQPHPDRVRLRFLQSGEDRAVKEARVLAGTTIFDAASWNGVAIDSTCGGHGTCKKCKVRVVSGSRRRSRGRPARVLDRRARAGWRLACRAAAQEDSTSRCRRSRPGRRRRSSASAGT